MMLNGAVGRRWSTSRGCVPGGGEPGVEGGAGGDAVEAMNAARCSRRGPARAPAELAERAPASTKSRRAFASASIDAKLAGVDDGASGATTTPARRAPRKSAA